MLNTPLKPLLLQPSQHIPTGTNYIHQMKLDGHRAIFHYDKGKITIFTRHLNNISFKYPELLTIPLPVDSCILDGEFISLDAEHNPPVPCFDSLMTRFQASNEHKIKELMGILPVHFSAFDILYLNGKSLLNFPLATRLEHLENVVEQTPYISRVSSYEDGEQLFSRMVDLGLEGIVSKNLNSKYILDSRPQQVWYKVKNYQYAKVHIGAIRKKEFGWLMLQEGTVKGILEFVPPNERTAFYHISKQLIRDEDNKYIYLEPIIQCEVKYQCLSKNGFMRSASFNKFIL